MTRKSKPSRRKFSVVSLYTGAGGLDYGFEAAGFKTRVAVEFEKDSARTIRANRDWPVIEKDIEQVSSSEILAVAGLRAGDVDLLLGGPPCQPFSKSSYWVRGDSLRLDDPRARTLYEYMRCVEELLPSVFVLENVHGISYSGKEEGFRLLRNLADRINRRHGTRYTLSWKVLNAAEFGVPQIRQRFFLVGHRDGLAFAFPDPTHQLEPPTEQGSLFGANCEYVTAWDAIGHLEPLEGEDLRVRGQFAGLLPSIPEGENYLWHTNRKGGLPLFGWRTRYWSFLLKLSKCKPSWTIQAQPGPAIGPFHWSNRLLSCAELAAIQTFPVGLRFSGSRVSVQRQIGNAVPSLLAEVIAGEIACQLFGKTRVRRPRKLAVKLLRPIPPPEPVRRVPRKYLSLRGNHADHPGEGKGRRIQRLETQALLVG